MDRNRLATVIVLGRRRRWLGVDLYLPAVLADAIARDVGISTNWLFAIFSASLVLSALLGPRMAG
jgi:hypothetical protein